MKIILINKRYHPEGQAGPAFSVQSLAEELAAQGHDVGVICIGHNLSGIVEHNDVLVHRLPPNTDAATAGEMVADILQVEQPQVVHTNWIDGFPVPKLAQIIKDSGARLVHTVREYRFLCCTGTMFRPGKGRCKSLCGDCGQSRPASREFASYVDGLVGVSQFCRDVHLSVGLFPNVDSAVVIHNGFNGPQQPVNQIAKPNGARLQLGYLGRISYAKGIYWVLRQLAHSSLADQIDVTIAGAGPPEIRAEIEKKLSNLRINWLGFVPPVQLMEKIDWLITPSIWHEPLGRVVFEAFAHGIPVIGSRLGGIPEMIRHGKNGRLFRADVDGEVLRELSWIIDNRELWPQYREQAWNSRTAFLPEKIADDYLKVYDRKISKAA